MAAPAAAAAAAARGANGASGSGPAPAPADAKGDIPWVEKYRPRELDDVVGNAEAVARLKTIAQDGNLPNVIFAGPPGCGKTTSIMCLCRALLGPALAKEAVLELNASDDRGIDVVRNKIKMFAQKKVSLPAGRHKVVILDEADSMTSGAQQALRRTMEVFSATTRFALACNVSTKIIEPIQSRCGIIRFSRLADKEVLERLVRVAELEKVATVQGARRRAAPAGGASRGPAATPRLTRDGARTRVRPPVGAPQTAWRRSCTAPTATCARA